ncbi:hypothetical protein GCM10022258_26440 [Aquimarina gracilis]
MNLRKFLAVFFLGALVLTSCSDDDDNPDPGTEEEVITTMTVTLTDGTDPVVLNFFDADGENGPIDPVPTVTGVFKANTTYEGTILLLNTTEDPTEIVNEEIEAEADEHQFFYLTEDLGITIAYDDMESDYVNSEGVAFTSENPVGIDFTLTTSNDTGNGQLRIVLRHELSKDAAGVSDGDITNAGGSPDIDWTFNISVE